MAPAKDWTIEELGELALGLQLLRSPTDMASSLGRDDRDVESKIAELGLKTHLRDEHSDGQKQIPPRRNRKKQKLTS